MEIILHDLQGNYIELVKTVINDGRSVTVRGLDTIEITNATLVFPDPTKHMLPIGVGRGINLKLAAVESLAIVAGVARPDLVLRAAPEFSDVLVDPDFSEMAYGAYGPRLSTQIYTCVELLRDDPLSRQAIAMVWRVADLNHVGDRPCTLSLQFLVRDGRLELHTTMRSNDVWLGTPYDVFNFTQLQQTVARALDLQVGQYVHHATSLHLYTRNLDATRRLRPFTGSGEMPHYDEPSGVTPIPRDDFTGFGGAQYAAHMLLLPPTRDAEIVDAEANRVANPWYARQMAKLQVSV